MAAVGTERISAVVGYSLTAGDFSLNTPNLPQRIAVLCEANTANQPTLDVAEYQATNLKSVGDRYGYGSPAYLIARIMLPIIGGIPLVFYPQAEAPGATAHVTEITPVGTATANATHTILIGGRDGLDGQFYNITIAIGDSSNEITEKITNAINGVIGSPVIPTDNGYISTLTTKWKGATASGLTVSIDTNGNDAGITYGIGDDAVGAGTPSIAGGLNLFGSKWNTILINSYGTNSTVASALEAFNGVPDSETPTGRYVGTVMKPFIALTGSVADDPSAFTDARKSDVTISISPAPNSAGFQFEAAANDGAIWAVVAQNSPELDILNKYMPDMPTPISIGTMESYNERDRIVKLGCSTVESVNGKYQFKDNVTTYHPDGDLQPAYRWRRDLMIDFNIRFRYMILEQTFLVGKVLANDGDDVTSQNVIKPKTWKQILNDGLFTSLVADGLIADADFSAESLVVSIDTTNPNRFNTKFKYKKTGVARISATTVESGFNLGTINI
jgi:phage tail sheath gpL-like